MFPFARNILNLREFAGVCFDPGGGVLFFNLQGDTVSGRPDPQPSMTFAVWGPWEQGPL